MQREEVCGFTFEELLDYAEGRMEPSSRERVANHAAGRCAQCRGRLEWLGQFLPALRGALAQPEVSAPSAALAFARDLGRRRASASGRPMIERLVARLVFDGRRQLAAAGARGARSYSYQRLFETENHYIDLWEDHSPHTSLSYLIGQAYPKGSGSPIVPEAVELLRPDGTPVPARAVESEFHIDGVPAGTYDLLLRMPGAEVLVPDVSIGA